MGPYVYTKLEYRSEIRLSRQNDLTRTRLGKICPHVNILLFSMDNHCFNDNNKNYCISVEPKLFPQYYWK